MAPALAQGGEESLPIDGVSILQYYSERCAIPGLWGEDYPPRPQGMLDFAWPSREGTYLLAYDGFWGSHDGETPIFTMTIPDDRPEHGWSLAHLDQYWLSPPDEASEPAGASRTAPWSRWPTQAGRFGTTVLVKDGEPRYCISGGDMQWVRIERLFAEGRAHLVCESSSVGTACCASLTIIAIDAQTPRLVFDYGGYGASRMYRSDLDQLVERGLAQPHDVIVHAVDPHWNYWPRTRIDDAPPDVLLKVDPTGGSPGGIVAAELMRMPRDAAEQLADTSLPEARRAMADAWSLGLQRTAEARQRLAELRDDRGGRVPPLPPEPESWAFWQRVLPAPLYAAMIPLFYGGHPDLAWALLRDAWPLGPDGAAVPGRDAVVAEIGRMLETCPHYPQVPWSKVGFAVE